MAHPVTSPEQFKGKSPEISDYPDRLSDTTVAFAMSKAVPEIVDEVEDSATLIARWSAQPVENGLTVDLANTMDEPDIDIKGSGTYTLMLVDADQPSPNAPKHRSHLLWLVVNIPSVDVKRGEVLVGYEPPAPAQGRHRLLFLLFKQMGRVTAKPPAKRISFQVKQWAKDHGLNPNPAAGLWVWAKSDEQ